MSAASESDPPFIELFNLVSGDTWRGIPQIGPVTIQGPDDEAPVQPSTTLVSVRLNFTREGARSPSIRFGTMDVPDADAPIVIDNAVTWEFSIAPVSPATWTPPAGVYTGHVETTDSDGLVLTIYKLQLTVTPDLTV